MITLGGVAMSTFNFLSDPVLPELAANDHLSRIWNAAAKRDEVWKKKHVTFFQIAFHALLLYPL